GAETPVRHADHPTPAAGRLRGPNRSSMVPHAPMGARTTAREAALQMLFAIEASDGDVDLSIGDFWRELPGDAEGRSYADEAVRGVRATLADLDARIVRASKNWRLERMTRVDRNLLRLGAWELVSKADVPRAVVLDE